MGEKFDTATGVMDGSAAGAAAGASGALNASASAEMPTTQEKPGTGSEEKPKSKPDRKRFANPSSWSGHDRYPDGYIMGRAPDGSIWLENPDGQVGIWDSDFNDWANPDTGKGLGSDWGGGHAPGKG
jgi:hypothetical protein